MTKCDHRHIRSYTYEDDGTPAPLWSCADCAKRFAPIDKKLELESALRACLTHMHTCGDPEAVRAAEAGKKLLGVEK